MRRACLVLFSLLSLGVQAAEVDSFTNRYQLYTPEAIQDGQENLAQLNQKTQTLITDAISKANIYDATKKRSCHEETLYTYMRDNFSNKYFDRFSAWVYLTRKLKKIRVLVPDSIYRDFKWYEAVVPGAFARVFKDPSAELLRVGNVILGADKFEHFMGSGFRYFRNYYLKEKGIKSALKIGFRAENGYMGAATTGVKAYADMIANFNGMRFWNHVLQKKEDILGVNNGPYIACKDNKWVQVKTVDWAFYLDDGFDEGINCSQFNTRRQVQMVAERLAMLERKDGKSYDCPMDFDKLEAVEKKYGAFSKWLINMDGHGKKEKRDEVMVNDLPTGIKL